MNNAIEVRVNHRDAGDWYQVPNRNDTRWIASGKMLPFYELMWLPYLTTVRDLMLAGF